MGDVVRQRRYRAALLPPTVDTASRSVLPINLEISGARELLVTWSIASSIHTNETYDLYITMGDGLSNWDIVHFSQVATTGVKTFTARIMSERLAEVTTATPGVAAEPSATFKTDTPGSNEGIRTLAAGKVRHGPFGGYIGYELVIAGSAPSINHQIDISAS